MSEDVPISSVFVVVTDAVTFEIRNSYIYGYDPAVTYSEEELDQEIELEVKSIRMTRRNFAQYV